MPEKTQLARDVIPAIKSLADLAKAENACTRCPLYQDAIQAVPGEGRSPATRRTLPASRSSGPQARFSTGP